MGSTTAALGIYRTDQQMAMYEGHRCHGVDTCKILLGMKFVSFETPKKINNGKTVEHLFSRCYPFLTCNELPTFRKYRNPFIFTLLSLRFSKHMSGETQSYPKRLGHAA